MDHRRILKEIKDIKDLGKFIEETRKAHHLTQEQLAARVGVSRRFIYQLENGSRESFHLGKVLLLLRRINLELIISHRKPE